MFGKKESGNTPVAGVIHHVWGLRLQGGHLYRLAAADGIPQWAVTAVMAAIKATHVSVVDGRVSAAVVPTTDRDIFAVIGEVAPSDLAEKTTSFSGIYNVAAKDDSKL